MGKNIEGLDPCTDAIGAQMAPAHVHVVFDRAAHVEKRINIWQAYILAGREVEPHLTPGCGWSGAVVQAQGISRAAFGS